MAKAQLIFKDGTILTGQGIGEEGLAIGEICFNTSITGYQEILTDPSYAGQIITFTFPHIGNVGVNDEDIESKTPAAKGLITANDITNPSNFRSKQHFNDWLLKNNIVGICDVDTRAITKKIRTQGADTVVICHGDDYDIEELQAIIADTHNLAGVELSSKVASIAEYEWDEKRWQLADGYVSSTGNGKHIVVIDYGVKYNILRCLSDLDCKVTVVPPTTQADRILALKPDGILLSNGPADPVATAGYAVPVIRDLLEAQIPLFGICMGHQLLGLALNCKTEKMEQGHRGANHPIEDLATGKVIITSQNHGFVVSYDDLPNEVEVTHKSLFDGTIAGIRHTKQNAFSVQFHPEASPGPQDAFYLFKKFVANL